MSPEAVFSNVFSTSSDVWSFGVLMWEIFTIGQTPFGHLFPLEFYDQLRRGLILSRPVFASDHIYATVMVPCWKYRPEERPRFAELRESLESLISATVNVGGGSDAASGTLPFGLASFLLD
nr:unnamed protein product [Spirometra erinaceieuropaei]